MQTIDDIFSVLGGPSGVGRIIGKPTEHAAAMRRRGSIPQAYWPQVTTALRERGVQIDGDGMNAIYRHERARRADPKICDPEQGAAA